ncbi:hypothetical protein, partial [Novipirellula herctigrandis]|uniref:hypothetical protein n=1 Tax=Novipirellula herctigrandis TaxID=2527986 RepID=UPI003AF35FCD
CRTKRLPADHRQRPHSRTSIARSVITLRVTGRREHGNHLLKLATAAPCARDGYPPALPHDGQKLMTDVITYRSLSRIAFWI